MFEKFLNVLPVTATSGFAFVAYLFTLFAFSYLASRQRRFGLLLSRIKELPEADRLAAIRFEMGEMDIPKGFSPENYLEVKRMRYKLAAVGVVCACIIVIFSLAIADAGSVSGSIDIAPGG